MTSKRLLIVAITFLAFSTSVFGKSGVVGFDLDSKGLVADGHSYGSVGPYEKLIGRVTFTIDPDDPINRSVVDLELAPREADGSIRYEADLYILRPADSNRGNGAAFMEICNRGGKAIVRYFNRGATRTVDPQSIEDFGDGFLMRHGFTLVWIGWQFDVPRREGLLRLHPAFAYGEDEPIRGMVRADAVFAEPTDLFPLSHRDHVAYPVAAPNDPRLTLTMRESRLARRELIPNGKWRLAERDDSDRIRPSADSIILKDGFIPGKIYEATYPAEDPAIVGLGLTAVRDLALGLKHHPDSPVKADRVLAIGISQTGRFLRHLLYQDFNHSADGRVAIDGVWAHTAGAGRGSFNHRFGQPSRDAHAYSAFFYPTDIFPFSPNTQSDSLTGKTDGLFHRMAQHGEQPKVFFTNTGYEYWGRAAALVHTSIDGKLDLELPESLRAYHFSSTQHFVGAYPPHRPGIRHLSNPADFFWILRSLLLELDAWVAEGEPPPSSRVPRLADNTLSTLDNLTFPRIPGVTPPRTPHQAYRMNYGPRFRSEGIVDFQPPRVGEAFPTLLPKVDQDGNEVGGVRLPEVSVPLATYTSWNLRAPETGADDEMADFRGSFFTFPLTDHERAESGDPRASLEARYPTRAHFLGQYALAAIELVDEGFLLAEDIPGLLRRAESLWELVHSDPTTTEKPDP